MLSAVSRVSVERVARCPFSVAHEYAEDFFGSIERGGAEVRVPLDLLVPSLGGRVSHGVSISVNRRPDEAETGKANDALEIDWSAGTAFFPDFKGVLRLRIASVDETRLSLEGSYRPPFGPLGTLFDTLAGRRIAWSTMRDLVDQLAGAMEQREAVYRARPPGSGITA
jgi:hypothetical protein